MDFIEQKSRISLVLCHWGKISSANAPRSRMIKAFLPNKTGLSWLVKGDVWHFTGRHLTPKPATPAWRKAI
jgi:hypothetical protein